MTSFRSTRDREPANQLTARIRYVRRSRLEPTTQFAPFAPARDPPGFRVSRSAYDNACPEAPIHARYATIVHGPRPDRTGEAAPDAAVLGGAMRVKVLPVFIFF